MDSKSEVSATFILLAYNQEAYIEAAVASALGQLGPKLEILISDDCSQDRTWDLINAAVADFEGKHKVSLNRNCENLGLTQHLNKCVEMAQSDILIAAAGDDVSRPDRSEKIIASFYENTPLLVHSDVKIISESHDVQNLSFEGASFYSTIDPLQTATSMALYVGATGAWHRDIFSHYGPLPENNCYEDLVLGYRAALEGRVHYINEKLVTYRFGNGISTTPSSYKSKEEWVNKRVRKLKLHHTVFSQRLKDLSQSPYSNVKISRKLAKAILKFNFQIKVYQFSSLQYFLGVIRHPLVGVRAYRSESRTLRRAVLKHKIE